MRALLRAGLLSLALLLAGCAPSATVTKGGGATIGEAQAEHYDGPKARIAVGTIVDKTSAAPLKSLSCSSKVTATSCSSARP
ncbi:MAG: hypothetical protein H6R47_723 [Proteobacteria bacterium]|nr:hypothetical protein [Pseudomonadota bacterium]